MKNILVPLLILGCFLCAKAGADQFNYSDFSSPTGMVFQGDASLHENFVRLTPSHTDKRGRVGGIWLESKQAILKGFEVTFTFRISDKVGWGADGFAFVLQNTKTPSLGLSGHHLGYARGGDAFAVVFDTYHWHRHRYVKYDEIAVTSSGINDKPGSAAHPLGTITAPSLYSDGKIHVARLTYLPGKMQIFLDNLKKPILTAAVRIEDFVSFQNNQAWVGFTASTGADSQNHDILSWTFGKPGKTSLPQPTTNTFAENKSSQSPAVQQRIIYSNANQPVAAPATSPLPETKPQVIGLPVIDGTIKPDQLRIRVPESVGLNHQVYASEDLVNWTLVTNLTLYFTDPAATNYEHRFYTFRETTP